MTTKFFSKKLYLDTEDTLEEVGISRRQLNYWREKGLIVPELGEDEKRFTEKDIRLLKFLRQLIVDQSFPVEIVRRIIDRTRDSRPWEEPQFEEFEFLGLRDGTLYDKQTLGEDLWHEFGATADEEEIRKRFLQLALLLFRLIKIKFPKSEDYRRERDDILSLVRGQDISARVEFGETFDDEPTYYLSPYLGREADPGNLGSWFSQLARELAAFEFTAEAIGATPEQKRRFIGKEMREAVRNYRRQQKNAASGEASDSSGENASVNFDDVPF